jgi:hypothetical protein
MAGEHIALGTVMRTGMRLVVLTLQMDGYRTSSRSLSQHPSPGVQSFPRDQAEVWLVED